MSIAEAKKIIRRYRNIRMKDMAEAQSRIWWLAKSTLQDAEKGADHD